MDHLFRAIKRRTNPETSIALRRAIDTSSEGQAASERISKYLAGSFVQREHAAIFSSVAGVTVILAVAMQFSETRLLVAIALCRLASLCFSNFQSRKLKRALSDGLPYSRQLTMLTLAAGISSFSWGLFLWPLEVSYGNSMAIIIVILAVVLAISLQAVTTAFYRPSLYAVLTGAVLSVGPKIYAIYGIVGIGLPLGGLVLLGIIYGYARISEAQLRGTIALQIKNKRMSDRLFVANERLGVALDRATWLAEHDSMTGLRNRRSFSDQIGQLIVNSFGNSQHWVFLIDVDHFKQINDRFGHSVGDQVLSNLAKVLLAAEVDGDILSCARWGGEEFVFVMQTGNPIFAELQAEALRQRINRMEIISGSRLDIDITVSVGGAMIEGRSDLSDALSRADVALYQAKESGRNLLRLAA